MDTGGSLRDLWSGGGASLGAWCILPDPLVVELLGRSGFDWVSIDAQHGLIGRTGLIAALGALASTGTPGFVRVTSTDAGEIGKALDAGAQGVIVPMVNCAEDARAAVAACRYPPEGERSWGPTRLALRRPGHTPAEINSEMVCVVMVETVQAVERVEEIVAVPGVDGVLIGPTDLAISAGLSPSTGGTHPEHDRLIERVLAACTARNVVAGIYCNGVDMARRRRAEGFRMLAAVTDVTLLGEVARAAAQTLRQG